METLNPSTFQRVWLIDDNDIDRLVSNRILTKENHGLRIESFPNANLALDKLRDMARHHSEELPDLILLDLYMPLMNGWHFTNHYRHLMKSVKKKIILLIFSCTNFDKDLRQINNYPEIDGYVHKPLTLDKVKLLRSRYF